MAIKQKGASTSTTDKITVAKNLATMIETFSKEKLKSQILPNEFVPEPSRTAIKKILELSELDLNHWLKIIYNIEGEFTKIKYPDIALLDGEVKLFIDDIAYPVSALLASDYFIATEKVGENGKTKAAIYNYYGHVSIKNSGLGTESLPINYWCDSTVRLETGMLCDEEYLKEHLYDYIFPLNTLEPGVYSVSEYGKTGNFYNCKIGNRFYYIGEKQATEQLPAREKEGLPLAVVVNTPDEKGKKSTYVEGFAYAMALKKFVIGLGVQPTDEILKAKAGLHIFEKPIRLEVAGLQDCTNQDGTKQKAVCCTHDDKAVTLYCNSPMKTKVNNGFFNLHGEDTYEGYYMEIKGVELGSKGYQYKITFHAPENVTVDESMTDLLSNLKLAA
jgi:hypothetical protein